MLRKYYNRSIIKLYFLISFFSKKKQKIRKKIINYNNSFVLKEIRNMKVKKEELMLLLPHCLQDYNCNIKITSEIKNCKICGKCSIGDIRELSEKYNIYSKVATGGTLARLEIKKRRPKVILAVACERDLTAGIYDCFPLPVYGLLNIRENGPCINTKLDVKELEKIIKKIIKD